MLYFMLFSWFEINSLWVEDISPGKFSLNFSDQTLRNETIYQSQQKAQILGAWGLIDLDSSRIRMTEDLSSLIQSLELNALSSD